MDHRLKKDKQFNYIYKKGEKINSSHLVLFQVDSKYKIYKIGFSVSKKIGKANIRNKIKRRMKEIVRVNSLPNNYKNYVLMVKPGVDKLSYIQLENEIKGMFTR